MVINILRNARLAWTWHRNTLRGIVDTVLQRDMIALFSVLGAELEGSSLALLIFSTLQDGGCAC